MSEVPRIAGVLSPQIVTHRVERERREEPKKEQPHHHTPSEDTVELHEEPLTEDAGAQPAASSISPVFEEEHHIDLSA